MAIAIHLKVYEGGKLKSARVFRAEQIRLGSGTCDLVLEGPGILPTHAVIDAGATGAVLRASGTAPIHLNGQPIIAAPLRHGDLISIGDLRVMVELRASAPGQQPERRPRLRLIEGEEAPHAEADHLGRPALSVVREPGQIYEEGRYPDGGLHAQVSELAEIDPPAAVPLMTGAAAPAQMAAPAVAPLTEAVPAPQAPPPIPLSSLAGGDCVEAELFWADTRLAVWQLAPGDELTAGTMTGCQAQLEGIGRAVVVRSDATGWMVCAPRPLALSLTENGKTTLGPELLVRGRSQADALGLLLPLPAKGVALLGSGQVALRVRRVPTPPQVAAEPTDWKGLFSATVAALVLVVAMKMLSQGVPPPRVGAEAEVIRPRPMIVRTTPKPADPLAPVDRAQKAEARRDPGKAVARHQGQEGQAGSKTAPRRDARAERARDERSIVASSGLLKALGAGKGASDVFGVALEKGVKDAMGHLTGPRAGEARGDGGMGLKSLGGHGGGGDGSGLGLARIGTNGIGGGLANYGEGKGGLHGKENVDIGLGPGKPVVVGSIDPELIRKVVHEHRAQIRTCYETQLTSSPNLAGKVVSAWTIDPTGVVTEAHTQESALHDKTVESCVAAKIKTWRFPIPKGGGEVFVTYPFIFTPGG
jgi:hypothetical protein